MFAYHRAPYQYTKQEIEDLVAYITEGTGKHVIGTYATFYHQEGTQISPHIYDNRRLAALFGLEVTQGYTTKKLHGQPTYKPTVKIILNK